MKGINGDSQFYLFLGEFRVDVMVNERINMFVDSCMCFGIYICVYMQGMYKLVSFYVNRYILDSWVNWMLMT